MVHASRFTLRGSLRAMDCPQPETSSHGLCDSTSSIDEMKEYVNRGIPCIVHLWTGDLSYWTSEYMHAAVVIRVEDETIYIHDPAFDDFPKQITIDEFSRAWFSSSQLLIVVEPLSDPSPHDNK